MSPTEAAAQHIRLYVLLVLPMVMLLLPRLGSFTRSIPFVYGLFRRGIQMFSPERIALARDMYIP